MNLFASFCTSSKSPSDLHICSPDLLDCSPVSSVNLFLHLLFWISRISPSLPVAPPNLYISSMNLSTSPIQNLPLPQQDLVGCPANLYVLPALPDSSLESFINLSASSTPHLPLSPILDPPYLPLTPLYFPQISHAPPCILNLPVSSADLP
jgi:hypothetical protein